MNILISATNLAIGGPSVFLLRLASHLAEKHRVAFYDHYHYYSDVDYKKWEPVSFYYFGKNVLADKLIWKVNALINILSPSYSLWEQLKNYHFRIVVKKQFRPHIILTTQQKTDLIAIRTAQKTNTKVILRLNSSYGLENEAARHDPKVIAHVRKIFSSCHGIIYTADFHYQRVLAHIGKIDTPAVKIMNGIPPITFTKDAADLLHKLHIDKTNSFIFGMVSRGEQEKGWEEAIEAFQLACHSSSVNLHLILVGTGAYLLQLKKKYQHQLNVHFVGYSQNPPDWIQHFDVALLPTYYANESTPNVIIEYLCCGKPVIATNYVEIPDMLRVDHNTAGILITLSENGKPNIQDIAQAMLLYVNNKDLWQRHVNFATKAAAKFDMNTCAAAYERFFDTIISNQ